MCTHARKHMHTRTHTNLLLASILFIHYIMWLFTDPMPVWPSELHIIKSALEGLFTMLDNQQDHLVLETV